MGINASIPASVNLFPLQQQSHVFLRGRQGVNDGVEGLYWLVLEEVRALAYCPVSIKGEPAVQGSGCRSLSPLYKASGELGETLQL